jgi:arylformamidase
MTTSAWIDISVPIYTGMVHWPDNPPVRVDYMLHMDRGDVCTVSTLSMGSHTGTHMDGPLHFVAEGLDLSMIDPGLYELICLPIKVIGSDGGPARAILRKIEGDQ